MLLEMPAASKHLSNSSATSGFVLEVFDFEGCRDFREGLYIWAFCSALTCALGFPVSIAILWEIFKTHRRGSPLTPNDFFILNLAVMDVVFLVFMPPGLLNYFIFRHVVFEAIWNGIYALNICGRPLLMACVCLDCYMAVVHPITYRERKSLTPRVVMAGIVWTMTVATGIAYCISSKLFLTLFPTVPFIIAVVIIGVCDSFILCTLNKSDAGRTNIHPQKQRAIQTLTNSLVVTVISYLPPLLLCGIGRLVIEDLGVFRCVLILMNITSTLGSAVMPVLYLHNLGKLDHFRLGCCRRNT